MATKKTAEETRFIETLAGLMVNVEKLSPEHRVSHMMAVALGALVQVDYLTKGKRNERERVKAALRTWVAQAFPD